MKLLKLLAVAALTIPAVSYAACPTSLSGGYSYKRSAIDPSGEVRIEIGTVTFAAPTRTSNGLGTLRLNFTANVKTSKFGTDKETELEVETSNRTGGYYLGSDCRALAWVNDIDDLVSLFLVVGDSGRFIYAVDGPGITTAPDRDGAIRFLNPPTNVDKTKNNRDTITVPGVTTDLGVFTLVKQ